MILETIIEISAVTLIYILLRAVISDNPKKVNSVDNLYIYTILTFCIFKIIIFTLHYTPI